MDKDFEDKQGEDLLEEEEVLSRRDFLLGLKKWSKVIIGGVVFGGMAAYVDDEASAGSWINRRGGWDRGGSWINRPGGWGNRGGSWANRGGSWGNRGGGGWGNRPRGGWVNRRGGGGWINRR